MDATEWTPLMHAVRNGVLETVQKLLKSEEKIHLKNMMGADLLTLSAASGNKSVFKIILEKMKNMSTDNTVDLSYGLHVAALFGHTDIVQLVLNAKCDPNAKDPISGATALMLATSGRHYSTVRLLLAYGALVDSTNEFCQSAIDIAETKQYNELVELLKIKVTHDQKQTLSNLLIPLELPKIEYTVKELGTVSKSTNLHPKRVTSPTSSRFSCPVEELLSPQKACTPEFANACHLSPVTSLSMYDHETVSPGNSVFFSENQVHTRTIYNKMKQTASQSNKAVEIGCSSNDVHHLLSPHNYQFQRNLEIPKKQDFSMDFDKNIHGEKFLDNFEHSSSKMFQVSSCSPSSPQYSPSPTSRNAFFSRSDPSVIHELNGGSNQQKGRKKTFWHSIRRRVRSLAHDKNGYHFYHPYCDTVVPHKCAMSSPRIRIDDDLKLKTNEVDTEAEQDNSPYKIVVSPLSPSLEFKRSYKNATTPVHKEMLLESGFKEFLCENGLHNFINIFLEHELDMTTFFELRDMDLREIGINSREDRIEILNVISSQSQYCV